MAQLTKRVLYDPPTFKTYARPADQWLEWRKQAYALPVAEMRRHAAVSTDNRHACVDCFCCACVAVLEEIR